MLLYPLPVNGESSASPTYLTVLSPDLAGEFNNRRRAGFPPSPALYAFGRCLLFPVIDAVWIKLLLF